MRTKFPLTEHPEIDRQHRQLVDCLDELQCFLGSEYHFSAVFTAIAALLHHTQEHFEYEERLMRDWRYPDIEAHIIEHQTLIDDVNRLWEQLQNGESFSDSVIHTLTNWVMDHINGEDLKYAPYVSQAEGP